MHSRTISCWWGASHHPFIDELVPLILSDTVSLDDGTAFVHCAPGCGPEDYEVGVKNDLEIFSPISPDGKYTLGIVPKELEGMAVNRWANLGDQKIS